MTYAYKSLNGYRHFDPEELFWLKVDFPMGPGCWEWTAYRDRDGYGLFCTRSIRGRAARIAYLLLVGDLPLGYVTDHLCRNRGCVNPYHLEPVTNKVNSERSIVATQIHCRRSGHPLVGSNVIIKANGNRQCRQCHADRQFLRGCKKHGVHPDPTQRRQYKNHDPGVLQEVHQKAY